ncbi:MAG: hypothetical protein ACUVUC_12955 [Thermoguttaceae bacterium]
MKRANAVNLRWIGLVVVAGMVVSTWGPGFTQEPAPAPAQPTVSEKPAAGVTAGKPKSAKPALPAVPAEKPEGLDVRVPGKKGGPAPDKSPSARLPNYYRQVVSPEQRDKILQIQKDYAPKIKALQDQLDALIKERNQKIEAVLTPQQRAKIEQLKAAAKKTREAKKTASPKPPAG